MHKVNLINALEHGLTLFSRISFRIWFAIVAFFIACGPVSHLQIPSIDRWFLNLSSFLIGVESTTAEIAVIEVSDSEFYRWENDTYDSGKLTSVLANIFYSADSRVGVLFDGVQPIELNQLEIAALSAGVDLTKAIDSNKSNIDLQQILKRKEYLLELLTNPRVTIGVMESTSLSPKLTVFDDIPLPGWLYSWFWYWCSYCLSANIQDDGLDFREETVDLKTLDNKGMRLNYFMQPQTLTLELPLLARNDQNNFTPSFLSQLFLSSQNGSSLWNPFAGFELNDRLVPSSFDGSIISLNEISHRWYARTISMSLDEALAVNSFPPYVLVVPNKYLYLTESLANGLYGLNHNQLLITPWWLDAISRFIIVISTIFFIVSVTRVSKKVFAVCVAVLSIVTLFISFILAVAAGLWLALSSLLVWFFVSWLLLSIWVRRRERLMHLTDTKDKILLNVSGALTEKVFLKEAFDLLRLHSSPKHIKTELYSLGDQLFQQGNITSAQEAFKFLMHIDKNYRDIQFRLELGVKTLKQKRLKRSKLPSKTIKKEEAITITRMGRYQIEKELGRGAMGVVYLGYDPNIARSVAIKVLNYDGLPADDLPNMKARFFREAKAAGRLSHPNIVSIYDVGEQADFAFIAMDFVAGEPLSQLVSDGKETSPFDVYRIIHDVALALEYAHQNGIVHRDIKPGNIMHSTYPYQVKVADFGIARLMDASKTSTGEIFGSPLYMSPEQLKGEKVGPASDVYSLGVTFYQLLSGKLPFAGDNLASLAYDIIHGKPKTLRSVRKGLPASAARIINLCLQKNVNDRYESAGELANALNKAIRRDFATQAKKVGLVL